MRKPKVKECKQCGGAFVPKNSIQPVCSPLCAIKYNSAKEVDKRVKVMKKESRSLDDLRAIARASFQLFIRMRDAEFGCISCPQTVAKWDGGHYYKAEVYTGLIFDEDNVHKQCAYCNGRQGGNLIEYRFGLIKRIGIERVEILDQKKDGARVYNFTRDELTELAAKYKLKIKQLKA